MVFSSSAIHFRRNVLCSRCISISRKEGLILLRLKYGNSALYVGRWGREAKLTNETFLILPLTAGRKRRRGGGGRTTVIES